MKKILKAGLIIFIVCSIGSLINPILGKILIQQHDTQASQTAIRTESDEREVTKQHATVLSVVDGDTLKVQYDDGTTGRMRLIGVDTPESVHPDSAKNVPEGTTASDYTKTLIKHGDDIWFVTDVQTEDVYGRKLAYVYLTDGRMLQDVLLAAGMARVMTVQPNSLYASHFLEVQRTAREHGYGFWAADVWD